MYESQICEESYPRSPLRHSSEALGIRSILPPAVASGSPAPFTGALVRADPLSRVSRLFETPCSGVILIRHPYPEARS